MDGAEKRRTACCLIAWQRKGLLFRGHYLFEVNTKTPFDFLGIFENVFILLAKAGVNSNNFHEYALCTEPLLLANWVNER